MTIDDPQAAPPADAPEVAYVETGSGDEITLRENDAAWRRVRFLPRVLVDVHRVDAGVELLGHRFATPVGVAPSALHGLAHPDAEAATAAGCAAAGALLVLSARGSIPLERVAAAGGGAPWWFQSYAMRDRPLTIELAQRAAGAGAKALVLTGDTPVVGHKHRATPGLMVAGMHVANLAAQVGREIAGADAEQDLSAGPDLIAILGRETGLPVLVKGVLRPDDARRMLDAGAAGLIVSNHGGRQLDRSIATADALPHVVEAVGGAAPVLVDGGVRSGLDVLAGLALGASAVLVGRPVVRALRASGADGVRDLLAALTADLEHGMALIGAPTVGDLGPHLLHH